MARVTTLAYAVVLGFEAFTGQGLVFSIRGTADFSWPSLFLEKFWWKWVFGLKMGVEIKKNVKNQ